MSKCIVCGAELTSADFNGVCSYCRYCRQTSSLMALGWICPKCGKVYSPEITTCDHCNSLIKFTYDWSTLDVKE